MKVTTVAAVIIIGGIAVVGCGSTSGHNVKGSAVTARPRIVRQIVYRTRTRIEYRTKTVDVPQSNASFPGTVPCVYGTASDSGFGGGNASSGRVPFITQAGTGLQDVQCTIQPAPASPAYENQFEITAPDGVSAIITIGETGN